MEATVYTRVVTNAGSLQVGDVVYEHRERILKIYEQTEGTCLCKAARAEGAPRTRNVEITSANALLIVTGGPTLDAANAARDLPTTPTGLAIWKRVESAEERDIREWTEYMAAKAPRIEVKFVRLYPFEVCADPEYVGARAVETAQRDLADFAALLNSGWSVTFEMFDAHEQQYVARLTREVRQ